MQWKGNTTSDRPRLGFQAVVLRHLILLTAVPVLVMAGAGVWYYGNLLEKAAEEQLTSSASHVRDQLDNHLDVHMHAVSIAAFGVRHAVRLGGRDALITWLGQIQRSYPGFLTMLIADRDGAVITATRRGRGALPADDPGRRLATVRDREYFQSPMATGKPFISSVFRGRGLGSDMIVAISSPYLDESGQVAGIVEGSIDITRIPLTPEHGPFRPAVAAHDRAGAVVFASAAAPAEWDRLRESLGAGTPGVVRRLTALPDPQFAVSMPLRNGNWTVTATLPLDAVERRSRTFYLYASAFLGLGLIVVGRAASAIARRVARPIVDIAAQMRHYEVGADFSASPADESATAEIWHIQHELNRLGVRLRESYDGLRSALRERDDANKQLESLLHNLDLKVAERTAELAASQARFALAVSGSNDGIWDWNVQTGQVYYSSRWKGSLGLPPDTDLHDLSSWLALAHPQDAGRLDAELRAYASAGKDLFQIEYRLRHADGSWRWMLCRGAAQRDEEGMALRIAGSQSDMTANKLADPLTGLGNRLAILEGLQTLISQSIENPSCGYAVLLVGLNRFKLINDTLGHANGDRLLVDVAHRLGTALSRAPEARGQIGRIGGDEFAILLESPAPDVVDAIVEAVQAEVGQPFHPSGSPITLTVSLGIAHWRPGYRLAEQVLRDADTAMYNAKTRGVAMAAFDDDMRASALRRLEIENALRPGLERGEFIVYYQPQVSLQTGRLFGMEALVRWRHPVRGMIPPMEFIPVAEETGLIQPLGRWILREACAQLARWRSLPGAGELKVSVNLSGRQLAEHDLPGVVRQILDETGLPGSSLHLEVTESVVAEDPAAALAILNALAAMEIGLEVDDFGTGYSSLSQLHRMPFQTLKIDRAFIQAIHTQSDGIKLVNSILMLAHTLGMHVVAEGIETADDVLQLAFMGCELAQGYYFSPPLDPARMQALLEGRATLPPLPFATQSELLALGVQHPEIAAAVDIHALGLMTR